MTCPDFIYSERGRRGIGVVQPQSGLDYPFVGNSGGASNYSPKIVYPVRALHAGGMFTLKNPTTNQTRFFFPTYAYNGTAGDLYSFGEIFAPDTEITVSYIDSINAAKAANAGFNVLIYASFEVVLVDAIGQFVGRGVTSSTGIGSPTNGTGGYYMTLAIDSFPEITFSGWVLANGTTGNTAPAAVYKTATPYNVAPQDDVRYLVADFFLAYDDPGEYTANQSKVTPPLQIKYLYNVGCRDNAMPPGFPTPRSGSSADIVIVDANDVTVFDTTTGAVESHIAEWGTDYKIYSWKKADQVCELVAHTTWSHGDKDKKFFAKYIAAVNAVLDARATYKMPRRLRTISVENGGTTVGPYTGKVRFRNGYNTQIIPAASTVTNFRLNTRVVFSAVSASGLGRYSNCPDTALEAVQPLKKLNGVAPVNGDLVIGANDCLWVRRPVEKDSDNNINPSSNVQQQIGADCPPCCECSDYVNTALYMNQVQSQYLLIGSRAEEVKLLHEQNVARWQDQRECSVNPLKLFLVPQRCPYMDIVMMICNPCQDCIPSSVLNLALAASNVPTYAEIVCGYTAMFAAGINGRAVPISATYAGNTTQLSAQFPLIRGGGSAYLKFRVKFSVRSQYAITGTLTGTTTAGDAILSGCRATDSGTRVPAVAEKTEALFCTQEGTTELPC